MKRLILLSAAALAIASAAAQIDLSDTTIYGQNSFEVPLWDQPVGSNGLVDAEVCENNRFKGVSFPTMRVFPAGEKANGAALLLCPGGGYYHESADNEGYRFTKWLNDHGITAVVLKYRLPNGHQEIPLMDAQRALRLLRYRAAEWGIDPAKVGIAGFSAGGHLASTAATHLDPTGLTEGDPIDLLSSRPDFAVLFYPVISMLKPTHKGSRINLMGENPLPEDLLAYSNELRVTPATPPCLLLLSHDDRTVDPSHSTDFYLALQQAKVPSAMYIFPEGGHGWGFKTAFRYHETMKSLIVDFLSHQGFIPQE